MKEFKKILVIGLIFSFSSTFFAQESKDYFSLVRENLGSKVVDAVKQTIKLTPDEESDFWPLYEEYTLELYRIHELRGRVVERFSLHFENMSDKKADEIWTSYLKYQKELLALQRIYYEKFKEILPEAKTVRYFQMENKIETLINNKLSEKIPLLEPKMK
jgi:hypothetical protein